MRRKAPLVTTALLAAACGHAPPAAAPAPAPAPVAGPATPVEPAPAPAAPAPEAPAAAAAAPAPTPPPRPLLGPVPGASSYVLDQRVAPTYCGGLRVVVRHDHVGTSRAIDPELVAVLELTGPTGLDFSSDHPDVARASSKAFQTWFERTMRTVRAARARYERQALDTHATAQARVEAAARMVIIYRRFADVLTWMELPANVRTGPYARDAAKIFCDTLADKAAPLRAKAAEAAEACARFSADGGVGPGWWSRPCALSPPLVDPAASAPGNP
jgi:hypothetical protein